MTFIALIYLFIYYVFFSLSIRAAAQAGFQLSLEHFNKKFRCPCQSLSQSLSWTVINRIDTSLSNISLSIPSLPLSLKFQSPLSSTAFLSLSCQSLHSLNYSSLYLSLSLSPWYPSLTFCISLFDVNLSLLHLSFS